MAATPEQLRDLLSYCVDFARTMLNDSGDFYPFGAIVGRDGCVSAVGGCDGNEKPKSQDIYRLLADAFGSDARSGKILAAALAANVDIPSRYSPPYPDGLRIHIEGQGFSRLIYVPYRLKREGLPSGTAVAELAEPISVEITPRFFGG
ncbi:MAG: hypothetical protein L0210_04905 [Rhodospirillales bacterium]|nr:hypothetical protein [Rhodospirillales bacterium]